MSALAAELPAGVRAYLPTLLIIGAPKCGTTSLHEYLNVHPEIVMSTNKEPTCFAGAAWVDRMAEYRDLFPRHAPVRGESSTAYSSYPFQPEIPERVRRMVPEARMIYIVRDPVERVPSHYAQNRFNFRDVRPWEELMADLEDPRNIPVWCSRYATQLERWLAHFPQEQLLVLDGRDLRTDRFGTLRRVLEFIGVDASFSTPAWEAEHNIAEEHSEPTPFGLAMERRGLPVPRFLTRPIAKPELTPELRERLIELLAPEVERFRALTGLKVDHWSV